MATVADKNTMKWVFLGLAIIALLALAYFVYKTIPTKGTTKIAPQAESSPGILGIIAGLFGFGTGGVTPKGASNAAGATKGFVCKIFPKICQPKGSGEGTGGELSPYTCDCGNVGYDTDGNYQAGCEQNGIQYQKDCQ